MVEALGLPLSFVSPVKWKKDLGLWGRDKDRSRQLAAETWPARAGWFARRGDDGIAEAALIALWAAQSTLTRVA